MFIDFEHRLCFFFLQYLVIGTHDWHPKCYLARSDCLVLEDLKGRGFQNRPYGTLFDLEHMKCVMKLLAQVHANSFEFTLATEARKMSFEKEHHYIMEEQYVVPGGKRDAEFEVSFLVTCSEKKLFLTYYSKSLPGNENAPACIRTLCEIS